TAIQNLPILTDEEQQKILVDWNNTTINYSNNKTLQQLFEDQVKRVPHNIAISCNGHTLTYKELNDLANNLANELLNKGVHSNSLVLLCTNRGLDMIIGLLGILKSGAAYIPIEPDYPLFRIKNIIEASTPSVIVTQSWIRLFQENWTY